MNEPLVRWTSYEVIVLDTERRLFSLALVGGHSVLTLMKLMRLVEALGWPEAKKLKYNGENRIFKIDDVVWLLKCKPHCWRVYFCILEAHKHFVYLHAVCKKKDKENPNDAEKARRIYNRLIKRTDLGVAPFEFPFD